MPAKHQSKYRKSLAESGRQELTVVVANTAAAMLRQIAREHSRTQGEVLALALMLARQQLSSPSAAVQSERQALPPVSNAPQTQTAAPETPPQPPEGAAELWWPANHRELLSGG